MNDMGGGLVVAADRDGNDGRAGDIIAVVHVAELVLAHLDRVLVRHVVGGAAAASGQDRHDEADGRDVK